MSRDFSITCRIFSWNSFESKRELVQKEKEKNVCLQFLHLSVALERSGSEAKGEKKRWIIGMRLLRWTRSPSERLVKFVWFMTHENVRYCASCSFDCRATIHDLKQQFPQQLNSQCDQKLSITFPLGVPSHTCVNRPTKSPDSICRIN